MRFVLDTNVVVSAMLSPHGAPSEVLRLGLQGVRTVLHDPRILAQYREVISRKTFGFDPADVSALIEGLAWIGESVAATPLPIELPDPDDLPFLEVASAGRADALVTGNARHFSPVNGQHLVRVLSPREAIALVAAGG